MNLNQNVKAGQLLNLPSGNVAITQGDLVLASGVNNRVFPVKQIDFVKTAAAGTYTAVTSAAATTTVGYERQAGLISLAGDLCIALPAAASLSFVKYLATATTVLLAATAPFTGITGTPTSVRMFQLTTGNILVTWSDATTFDVCFGIMDSNFNVVVDRTIVAATYNTGAATYYDACVLSGGGFAVTYQNTAHTQQVLKTYSNAGVAVLGATNVQAWGGGGALVYCRMKQLSNGNLAIAFRSGTATPTGTTFIVVDISGVSVKTNTVMDAAATAGFVSLSVSSAAYFAIGCENGTNAVCSVYNNAGTLQGGKFTGEANTNNSAVYIQYKVITDDINFYFGFVSQGTIGGLQVVQIPFTGTNFVGSRLIVGPTATANTASMDMEMNNGTIIALLADTGTAVVPSFVNIDIPDATIGIAAPNRTTTQQSGLSLGGSAAATTGTYWPRILPTNDFAAVGIFDKQNVAATMFMVAHMRAVAIIGVSRTTVAANSPGTAVEINCGSGKYVCNVMTGGVNGGAFDHTSGSPKGNSGCVFTTGVALGGIA